jgi:DNA-directed RNA polymerase subunit M/transcription elongation factor TFIIS
MSDIHFCNRCQNMTTLYVKEDGDLIHYCKACEETDVYQSDGCPCVYSIDQGPIDISQVMNKNKYLTHDVTLPKIKGNPNVRCLRADCPTNCDNAPSSVTYLKYDFENMNYIYVCDECGSSWTNDTV